MKTNNFISRDAQSGPHTVVDLVVRLYSWSVITLSSVVIRLYSWSVYINEENKILAVTSGDADIKDEVFTVENICWGHVILNLNGAVIIKLLIGPGMMSQIS